jgi:peptidoglycan/LPS O-acetylase OafA/YrhL
MRWLLPTLFGLSLFIHRPPVPNFNTFHSLLYYLPVYLFGAVCARDQATVLPLCVRRAGLWWALGLAMTALQAEAYLPGNLHKPFFQYAGLDVNLLGKMFLTLGILGGLAARESRPVRLLDFFAEYSFPIYFLHPLLIMLAGRFVDHIPFRTHLFMLPVIGIAVSLAAASLAWLYFAAIRKLRPPPSKPDRGGAISKGNAS